MAVRRAMPRLFLTAGGALVIVASFLPWVRSGSVERSSYRVFGLVERLGYASDGPVGLAIRWWPVLPLVVTVSVVLSWWDHRRSSAVFGLIGGSYAAAVAAATARAPVDGFVEVLTGPTIALAGAVAMLVGAVWVLVDLRRAGAAP